MSDPSPQPVASGPAPRPRREKRRTLNSSKDIVGGAGATTTTAASSSSSSAPAATGSHPSSSSSSTQSWSSFGFDLRDPFQLVALAVRFDESRQDEDLLKVPLESGRLYDTVQFSKALEYLQNQQSIAASKWNGGGSTTTKIAGLEEATTITGGSVGRSSKKSGSSSALNKQQSSSSLLNQKQSKQQQQQQENQENQPQSLPSFALTPIILSGLLTVIQQQRELADIQAEMQQANNNTGSGNNVKITSNKSNINNTTTGAFTFPPDINSSDLVITSQTMRQAALSRVRLRKRRMQLQKIILPIFSIVLLFGLYLRTVSDLRKSIVELRYLHSCEPTAGGGGSSGSSSNSNNNNNLAIGTYYESACRFAEAALWERYRNYLLTSGIANPTSNKKCAEPLATASSLTSTAKIPEAVACDHKALLTMQKEASTSSSSFAPYFESPFTMHTTLSQEVVALEDIDHPRGIQGVQKTTKQRLEQSFFQQKQQRTKTKIHNDGLNDPYPFRWMGESIANRLVREAIETYLSPKLDLHILDAGSGVAGTLYALLPPYHNNQTSASLSSSSSSSSKTSKIEQSNHKPKDSQEAEEKESLHKHRNFSYHGITLSVAEVYQASRLVEFHGLNDWVNIVLEQRSYDDRMLPFDQRNIKSSQKSNNDVEGYEDVESERTIAAEYNNSDGAKSGKHVPPYTVVVAIESLTFSRNLRETVANLVSSLQKGGLLIVVDDVALPTEAARIAMDPTQRRPSTTTHETWIDIFKTARCEPQFVRDLSLEYALIWKNLHGILFSSSTTSSGSSTSVNRHGKTSWWGWLSGSSRSTSHDGLGAIFADGISDGNSEMGWFSTIWRTALSIFFLDGPALSSSSPSSCGSSSCSSTSWLAGAVSSASARRLLKLEQDRTELARAVLKRQAEYDVRSSMAYHMYVCKKK